MSNFRPHPLDLVWKSTEENEQPPREMEASETLRMNKPYTIIDQSLLMSLETVFTTKMVGRASGSGEMEQVGHRNWSIIRDKFLLTFFD